MAEQEPIPSILADIFGDKSDAFADLLLGTIIAGVVVMIIHRVFQRQLLGLLDELRNSSKLFNDLLKKKQLAQSDKDLLGRLAMAYAVVTGLIFLGIVTLIASMATPLG